MFSSPKSKIKSKGDRLKSKARSKATALRAKASTARSSVLRSPGAEDQRQRYSVLSDRSETDGGSVRSGEEEERGGDAATDRGPDGSSKERGGMLAQSQSAKASAAFTDQMHMASSSDEDEDDMMVTVPADLPGQKFHMSDITAASDSDDYDESEDEDEEEEVDDIRESAARLLRQVSLAQKNRRTNAGDLESSIEALLEAHSLGSDSAPHPSNASKDVGEMGDIRANAARLLRQVSLAQNQRRGTDAGGDLESSINVLLEVHASMNATTAPAQFLPSLAAIQDEEEEERKEPGESTGKEDDGVRANAARLLRQASTMNGGGSDDGGLESSIKALLVAHTSDRDGAARAGNGVGGTVAEGEMSGDDDARTGAERLLRRVQSRGGNSDGGDLGSSLKALLEVHKSMREGDKVALTLEKNRLTTIQDKEWEEEEEEEEEEQLHESMEPSKPVNANLKDDNVGFDKEDKSPQDKSGTSKESLEEVKEDTTQSKLHESMGQSKPANGDLGEDAVGFDKEYESLQDHLRTSRRSGLGREFEYKTDLGGMLDTVKEAGEKLRASLRESGDAGEYYDQMLELNAGRDDAFRRSLGEDMNEMMRERREARRALDALQREADTLRRTLEETEGRTPRRKFFKGEESSPANALSAQISARIFHSMLRSASRPRNLSASRRNVSSSQSSRESGRNHRA